MWTTSKIVPVRKKDNRHIISNYRPVAIVSNFSKVFEICVNNLLYSHIENSIIPEQHGFMKGRLTITNLTIQTQYIADPDRNGVYRPNQTL